MATSVSGWTAVAPAELEAATASAVGSSLASEVSVRSQRGVGLYDGDAQASGLSEGTATLTSHSVFFQCQPPKADGDTSSASPICVRLALSDIDEVRHYGGVKFFSRPKVVIVLSSSAPNRRQGTTKISFRQGGQPDFLSDMRVMLEKKRWTVAAPAPQPAPAQQPIDHHAQRAAQSAPVPSSSGPAAASTGAPPMHAKSEGQHGTDTSAAAPSGKTPVTERAGIRGLVDRRDAAYEAQQTALRSSTADLDALMRNATAVQAMVKSLKQAARGSAASSDEAALKDLEVRLGIAAPVTRSAAGRDEDAWRQDLGSELAVWLLRHPTLRSRPSIPLTELFALYNRGRGSDHVLSPKDVLHACEILASGSIGSGTSSAAATVTAAGARWDLVTEHSGIVKLHQTHASSHALGVVAQLLGSRRGTVQSAVSTPDDALAAYTQGVRASELAGVMHVSMSEAMGLLETLEDEGTLCRGAPRGLNTHHMRPLFYWNPFVAAAV